jgi:hypothetical protein
VQLPGREGHLVGEGAVDPDAGRPLLRAQVDGSPPAAVAVAAGQVVLLAHYAVADVPSLYVRAHLDDAAYVLMA